MTATDKKLEILKKAMDVQAHLAKLDAQNQKFDRALFGDVQMGEMGLVQENHMMFEFFSGAMVMVRIAKWGVAILATGGTFIAAIYHLFGMKTK